MEERKGQKLEVNSKQIGRTVTTTESCVFGYWASS